MTKMITIRDISIVALLFACIDNGILAFLMPSTSVRNALRSPTTPISRDVGCGYSIEPNEPSFSSTNRSRGTNHDESSWVSCDNSGKPFEPSFSFTSRSRGTKHADESSWVSCDNSGKPFEPSFSFTSRSRGTNADESLWYQYAKIGKWIELLAHCDSHPEEAPLVYEHTGWTALHYLAFQEAPWDVVFQDASLDVAFQTVEYGDVSCNLSGKPFEPSSSFSSRSQRTNGDGPLWYQYVKLGKWHELLQHCESHPEEAPRIYEQTGWTALHYLASQEAPLDVAFREQGRDTGGGGASRKYLSTMASETVNGGTGTALTAVPVPNASNANSNSGTGVNNNYPSMTYTGTRATNTATSAGVPAAGMMAAPAGGGYASTAPSPAPLDVIEAVYETYPQAFTTGSKKSDADLQRGLPNAKGGKDDLAKAFQCLCDEVDAVRNDLQYARDYAASVSDKQKEDAEKLFDAAAEKVFETVTEIQRLRKELRAAQK